jgi:hypothetical protein
MNNLPILSGLNDHQLGVLIVFALISQVWAIIKLRSTGKDAKAANEQTSATGNGFAGHVMEKLDLLKDSSDLVRNSMKSVAGKQDDQRVQLDFLKEYVQRVDKRLQDHMEYHVRESR